MAVFLHGVYRVENINCAEPFLSTKINSGTAGQKAISDGV
jgi:hypothetical protein